MKTRNPLKGQNTAGSTFDDQVMAALNQISEAQGNAPISSVIRMLVNEALEARKKKEPKQ